MKWPAIALLLALLAGCRTAEDAERLAGLQRSRDRLRQAVDEAFGADPVLVWSERVEGDLAVAFRSGMLQSWLESSVVAYLANVELDLPLDEAFREGREVKIKTLVGSLTAGRWDVEARLRRVRARLSVESATARFAQGGRLGMELSVRLVEARSPVHVAFRWDARALAGAVCRDFRTELDVEALARPARYEVTGDLALSAEGDAVLATPTIPDATRTFRLHIDLTQRSWAQVRAALEEQDKLTRCGLALKPDEILDKLHSLAARGVPLRVPASVFAPLELPTRVQPAVEVQGMPIRLDIRTTAIDSDAERVWYAARVAVASGPIPAGGTPAPGTAAGGPLSGSAPTGNEPGPAGRQG